MSVPFDRLGPGQVGRLAYQVLGSQGPISNPAGIRYLSPDDPSVASLADTPVQLPGASMWAGAAQFVTLGLSLANLGVSTATLIEVRHLAERVDALAVGLSEVAGLLEEILGRVERIDANVAENNLRAALMHVLPGAVQGDTIDLDRIQVIERDVDKFLESIEPFDFGLCPGLTLSTDVRDMIQACLWLLWGSRTQMLQSYNQAVGGNPEAVIDDDYFFARQRQYPHLILMNISVRDALGQLARQMGKKVYKEFILGDFKAWVDGRLHEIAPAPNLVADLLESHLMQIEEQDDQISFIADYLERWLAHSDSALLWRLKKELRIRSDESFWRTLDNELVKATSASGGQGGQPSVVGGVLDLERATAVLG